MDVVLVFNGLGNQLSQYALALSKRSAGQNVVSYYAFGGHNGYELEDLFGIEQKKTIFMCSLIWIFKISNFLLSRPNKISIAILKILRIRIVFESNDYCFDSEILKPWFGLRFLVGGWHDSRYFSSSEELLRKVYRFPSLDEENMKILDRICASFSVSIHIRRGDYLDPHNRQLFGSIATIAYYKKAIIEVVKLAEASGLEPNFFIFSDDIEWCRETLVLSNVEFISINNGKDSWKDLALMSKCRVNILANSTFSWWAAWLNQNSDKYIFCPMHFVSTDDTGDNIFPPSWIKIES